MPNHCMRIGLSLPVLNLVFFFGCGFMAPKEVLKHPNETPTSASNADGTGNQGNETIPTECPTGTPNPAANAEAAVTNLINAKCTLCHGSAGQAPVLGTTAANTAAKAKILQSVAANTMPPGAPLSASEKKVIEDWGAAAALNLFDANQPITYYNGIKDIMDTRCAYCHTQATVVGKRHDPKLTSYQEVSSKIDDVLQEIGNGSMPDSGRFTGTNVSYPGLSANEIQMIEDWKADGSPKGVAYAFNASKTIAFDTDVWPLIQGRCLACHSTGRVSPNLNDKAIASAASATIAAVVANSTMPPGVPLEAEEKKLIAAWAALMAKSDATQSPNPASPKPATCP